MVRSATRSARPLTAEGVWAIHRRAAWKAWGWSALLLAVLGILVLYPVLMLLLGALTHTNPVAEGYSVSALTLENFRDVLSNAELATAAANTLIVGLGGTAISVTIGLFFSWVIARTNTPLKGIVEIAGMLPLFIPPLVGALAWSILGSPSTGLLNVLFKAAGLPLRVNLYSMAGMIFVFGIYYAPYVYMFTASALKNMDPSLEEASEISGVGPVGTLFRVTFPLVAPAILSGAILAFVVMLGIYSIPAILATPARLPFLTTYIYTLITWTPPYYDRAAATSVLLIAATAVGVLVQQRLLGRRSYVTVAGKAFRPKLIDLGRWKYVTLGLSLVYILAVVVLPYAALAVAAFRKFLFIPSLASLLDRSQYSLMHFTRLFDSPFTLRSIVNTFEVASVAALAGGVISFALGYTIHRTAMPGRRLLDFVASVPVAVPGLVIGVAYVWAWVGLPGGIYGTIWILALAFVARFLPDTVKALSSTLVQVHPELEEASVVCGRGRLGTIWRVVLPLAWPGILSAMSLLFILSIRELGSSIFLYTSNSMVMSVLLLDFWEGGNIGLTAAFSVVQSVLLLAVIAVANRVSRSVMAAEKGG